jgi:hypothetical protein
MKIQKSGNLKSSRKCLFKIFPITLRGKTTRFFDFEAFLDFWIFGDLFYFTSFLLDFTKDFKMIYYIAVAAALMATANAKIYFQENFNDKAWDSRWVVPTDWKAKVTQCHNLKMH